LQLWSPCLISNNQGLLQMLSNISARLADMHEAGFVHRDLKPANVMWLPRENRWTIIDFGCAARIGAPAPLSFTLAYAAPEVVHAFEMGAKSIESTPALDAWSLGVMAFELLTGLPAFRLVTNGRSRVCCSCRFFRFAHGLTLR
jgi:serine/threonine protein kinase